MKKDGVKKWFRGFLQGKPSDSEKGIECQKVPLKEEEDDWIEAEAEIINHLIHMDSLMKITKQLDYYYEYITLEEINNVLCQEIIDVTLTKKALLGGLLIEDGNKERKFTSKSLPYQYYSIRSLLWKVSLGYLRCERKQKWISSLERNLIDYSKMTQNYIIKPLAKKLGSVIAKSKSTESSNEENTTHHQNKDHPLNFSQESKWQNYFKDLELWKIIQKDVRRTRSTCTFFQEPHDPDLGQIAEAPLKTSQLSFTAQDCHTLTYADCLTRIIFIYLKKHPQQQYCQGMNEMAALVLYCFTNKNSEYFRRVSESDSYFIFEHLLSLLPKKHFQKGEDYVKKFISILLKMDFRLYEELKKQNALESLQLFTMRWFLTGFLSQFPIDECLQLWDTFMGWPEAEVNLGNCFLYMGLAAIHLHRDRIMEGENLGVIFAKLSISAVELGEKTLNLYKLFPKLVN